MCVLMIAYVYALFFGPYIRHVDSTEVSPSPGGLPSVVISKTSWFMLVHLFMAFFSKLT